MEKVRLLTNALLITAFSCIAIALYSCDPEDSPTFRDSNKLILANATSYKLDIRFNWHSMDEPFGCFIEAQDSYEFTMGAVPVCEAYYDFYGSGEDVIESFQVYIDGKLRKSYVGPAKNLPDSVHSVYNINSWKFGKYLSNYGNTKGDSLETLTFTFTDEDFADDASGKNETE